MRSVEVSGRGAYNSSFAAIVFLVVCISLLAMGRQRMLRDPGTLWHTVVGEHMLSRGEITRTDEFSFTQQGQRWPAQQWLAECAMGAIHRVAGLDGLLLAGCAVIAATFAMLAGRLRRAGVPVMTIIVLTALAIAASSYHFIPRPHLATIILTAWTFGLLSDVEAGRTPPAKLLYLPPVMVLWTNLHGGALGGLGMIVFATAGWWIAGILGQRAAPAISKTLLGATVCLSAAAILCNPFGASLPAQWLGLMSMKSLPQLIIEHAPLQPLSGDGMMVLVLAGVYIGALWRVRRGGLRVTWFIPLVWFILTLGRVRHGPLFAVTAMGGLAELLPRIASRFTRESVEPSRELGRARVAGNRLAWAACVGCALLAFSLQSLGIACPVIGSGWARLSPDDWPIDAEPALRAAIRQSAADGQVFNELGFGGYLIYRVPEAKVYIDDRCELYGEAGLRRYVELLSDPCKFDAAARYEQICVALLRAGSTLDRALSKSDDWALRHRDETAVVYARRAATSTASGVAVSRHPPSNVE